MTLDAEAAEAVRAIVRQELDAHRQELAKIEKARLIRDYTLAAVNSMGAALCGATWQPITDLHIDDEDIAALLPDDTKPTVHTWQGSAPKRDT